MLQTFHHSKIKISKKIPKNKKIIKISVSFFPIYIGLYMYMSLCL